LDPAYLDQLIKRRNLPQDWLIAIIDQSGTLVARSRDADRYVGQKTVDAVLQDIRARDAGTLETDSKDGIPVATAFVRSKFWGWTAVTGAPQSQLDAEVRQITGLTILLLVAGLALGSAVAYVLARQVLSSVRDLNEAALALQHGKPIELPKIQLKEAQAVGAAIVQASFLMEEARHRATHDPLTRLGNRELFFAMGHHHIAEAQRSGRSLALLAIDLDNFKQVNDSEGHPKGDRVLKAVSLRINAVIRASDIAARTGGDEFCVLLVDADNETAASIAARIVDEIARPIEGVRTPIGASIGIAIYPNSGADLQALVESADKALYSVKRSGRNGFQFA
jgi:diguanylate cyclase (GGDEF)-like protein